MLILIYASVAQLDRAQDSDSWCRGFKSCQSKVRFAPFFFDRKNFAMLPCFSLVTKNARSFRLLDCKRTYNGSKSLPPFCESACGAKKHFSQMFFWEQKGIAFKRFPFMLYKCINNSLYQQNKHNNRHNVFIIRFNPSWDFRTDTGISLFKIIVKAPTTFWYTEKQVHKWAGRQYKITYKKVLKVKNSWLTA